ncbi:alpha/beta hydrolase [Burkholderia cenocepacia]|uniref:alpha/beta hydrolase n=1 Tax=Burkholderia cenocepacia TaxID=95486 RepID=UPI002856EBDC|nr:alpha/beta hydrolase [Burkholderia cenocepacia]MDR8071868.1 alpha/beta hydrolase [Burkholderia cenocepacia]
MFKIFFLALAVVWAYDAALASDVFLTKSPESCKNPEATEMRPSEVAQYYTLQAMGPANMTGVRRIFYGKGLDQYGDLRLPDGKGPFPLAIVIHGGAWTANVNSDYITPVSTALTTAGIATWTIEYSRLGSGGEWPGSFKSVAAAADYIRTLAKHYPISSNHVIAIGHSAGGHYALWLAARHNIKDGASTYANNPIALQGVISLDGTPDLAAFAALPRGTAVIPRLLGAPKEDWKLNLGQTSPAQLLPLGVPQYFLIENSDRLPSMMDYIAKANDNGDSVDYDIVCPPSHFTTTDPTIPLVGEAIIKHANDMLKTRN